MDLVLEVDARVAPSHALRDISSCARSYRGDQTVLILAQTRFGGARVELGEKVDVAAFAATLRRTYGDEPWIVIPPPELTLA